MLVVNVRDYSYIIPTDRIDALKIEEIDNEFTLWVYFMDQKGDYVKVLLTEGSSREELVEFRNKTAQSIAAGKSVVNTVTISEE